MTTIAYRDGVLAVDSLFCRGPVQLSNEIAAKLVAVPNGWVAGCGESHRMFAAFESLQDKQRPLPTADDDTTLVRLFANGIVQQIETGYAKDFIFLGAARYFARGTGIQFAMGALAAGATAVEAVRIAARFDPDTGGAVQWVDCREGVIHLDD